MNTEVDTKALEIQLRNWATSMATILHCLEDDEPVIKEDFKNGIGRLLVLLDMAHVIIKKEYIHIEGCPEEDNPMWPLICTYTLGSFVYNRTPTQYREEAESEAA